MLLPNERFILLQQRKNAAAPPIPSGLRGRTPGDSRLKFSRRSFCLLFYSTNLWLFYFIVFLSLA